MPRRKQTQPMQMKTGSEEIRREEESSDNSFDKMEACVADREYSPRSDTEEISNDHLFDRPLSNLSSETVSKLESASDSEEQIVTGTTEKLSSNLDNHYSDLSNDDFPEDIRRTVNSEETISRTEETMLKTDTDDAMPKRDDAMLRTVDAMLRTDDAMLRTDDAMLRTDDAMLRTDDAMLRTDDAILEKKDKVGLNKMHSGIYSKLNLCLDDSHTVVPRSPCMTPNSEAHPLKRHSSSILLKDQSENKLVSQPSFAPFFVPEYSSDHKQSSVKQLESFVASVETHSPTQFKEKRQNLVQSSSMVHMKKQKNCRLKADTAFDQLRSEKSASRIGFAASDPNQPLDLSVKSRGKEFSNEDPKYIFPNFSYSDVNTKEVGNSESSLANLEKQFGNASAIFDRIGTKLWTSPFNGAMMSRLGSSLYNSKLNGIPSLTELHMSALGYHLPTQQLSSLMNSTRLLNDSSEPGFKPDSLSVVNPIKEAENSVNCHSTDPCLQWQLKPAKEVAEHQKKQHTNFQCSCGAEIETLYKLTVHLQQTGHAPNKMKNTGRQEYSKLVRGQDMWLNHGCEQTRQILRCMECNESFKSLPELTVHMIQTKHYANIVGADTFQQRKPMSKNFESRSEPSSDSNDLARVHCLVCLDTFDDVENLGYHIIETGHYKNAVLPKPEGFNDNVDSKMTNDISDDSRCSANASPDFSPFIGNFSRHDMTERKRHYSTDENNQSWNKEDVISSAQIAQQHKKSKFSEYERKRSESSERKESVGLEEKEKSTPKDFQDFKGVPTAGCPDEEERTTSESIKEQRTDSIENSDQKSLFAPLQQSSHLVMPQSDNTGNSAIQAMESFIKNSFSIAETKNISKFFRPSESSTIISPNKSHPTSHNTSGLTQNSGKTNQLNTPEVLENSNLYQNKYLPPVYIPSSYDVRSVFSKAFDIQPLLDDLKSTNYANPGSSQQSPNNEQINSIKQIKTEGHEKPSFDTDDPEPFSSFSPKKKDDSSTNYSNNNNNHFLSSIELNPVSDLKSAERTKGGLSIFDEYASDAVNRSTPHKQAGSSALESLQGLVYGRSLNSEHPLDSLQKLIYGRGVPTAIGIAGQKAPHTAVIMRGTEALQQSLPPGTLILVNPIVAVVSAADNCNSSLKISLPESESSSSINVALNAKSEGHHQSPLNDRENDYDSLRIYRCRACKRKFSSKGSYRYHLSRCHILTNSEKCNIQRSMKSNPYICFPLDAAKYNKHYKVGAGPGTEAAAK